MEDLEAFIRFDAEQPPTDDDIFKIQSLLTLGPENISKSNLDKYIKARFDYLYDATYNAATVRNDDFLIEVVGRFMWNDGKRYDAVKSSVVAVCFKQFEAQLRHRMFEMQLDFQNFEDMYQEVYGVICEYITKYEADRNQFSAFITRQVNKILYEAKNKKSGSVVSTTRYGASVKKHALNAKNALIASGRTDPGYDQIARYINTTGELKKQVTSKMVENALSTVAVQVEMDEKQESNIHNPEEMLMQKMRNDALFQLKDAPTLSKDCQALLNVLIQHFIVEGNRKMMKADRLREQMRRITGKDYSADQLASIKYACATYLGKTGWFPKIREFGRKDRVSEKVMDDFIAEDEYAMQIEDEIFYENDPSSNHYVGTL